MRWILLGLVLLLTACGGDEATDETLPTAFEFPTETATSEPTATDDPTATPADTNTPVPPSATPTPSNTPGPTNTPTPVTPTVPPTLTATQDPTRAAELTRTASSLELPRFATLTPVIIDGQPAPTSTLVVVAADVTITEGQFQEAINELLAENEDIRTAEIDFEPGEIPGIRVQMLASGGQALINGEVFVAFQLLEGGLFSIQVTEISTGGTEPPEGYIAIAQEQLPDLFVQALDRILNQRLTERRDPESIRFTESTMEIMLLVPQT